MASISDISSTPEGMYGKLDMVSRTMELRVHGVGGDPPHSVLGCAYATDVKTRAKLRDRIAVVEPMREDGRTAYVWGELTSGSALFALWSLLLPFTLANVAGWMHPRLAPDARKRRKGRIAAIRALVFFNGLVLTAATVCWLATLMIGLAGYDRGVVFTSFLVAAALLGALTGSKRFEGYLPLGRTAVAHSLLTPKLLTDPTFFGGRRTFWWRWPWHVIVAAATCVLVLVFAAEVDSPRRTARVGTWSMWLTTGGCALALVVTVLSIERGRSASMWRWGGSGTVSAFAHVLVAGVAAALLNAIPAERRPDVGRGLALLDVWGVAFVAGAAVAVVTAIVVLQRASPYENAGLPNQHQFLKRPAFRAARIAQLPRHLDLIVTAVATTAMVGSIWVVVIEQRGWKDEWTPVSNWATRVSLAVLAPLVFVLVRDVRRNASSLDRRRRIGQIWDVMAFWPRAFHPLAVRPYSERAVPELIEILSNRIDGEPNDWVVTAHSQGAVLAIAAMAAGDDEGEDPPTSPRLDLITFGSPARNLYAKAFPHYFGDHLFTTLRDNLAQRGGTWLNVWRATDPVGREMFEEALDPHADRVDVNDQQPNAVAPCFAPEATDFEQDPPVGVVAGHSGYRRTDLLRSAVSKCRQSPN